MFIFMFGGGGAKPPEIKPPPPKEEDNAAELKKLARQRKSLEAKRTGRKKLVIDKTAATAGLRIID